MAKLVEKQKSVKHSQFLIILYDDLFRRQLAKRANRSEPDLDVQKSFRVVDATILVAATLRLEAVLEAAGLRSQSGPSSAGTPHPLPDPL